MISNQRWDELSQSWIITTLKAPAGIISKDVIDKLGLESTTTNKTATPTTGKVTSPANL